MEISFDKENRRLCFNSQSAACAFGWLQRSIFGPENKSDYEEECRARLEESIWKLIQDKDELPDKLDDSEIILRCVGEYLIICAEQNEVKRKASEN